MSDMLTVTPRTLLWPFTRRVLLGQMHYEVAAKRLQRRWLRGRAAGVYSVPIVEQYRSPQFRRWNIHISWEFAELPAEYGLREMAPRESEGITWEQLPE